MRVRDIAAWLNGEVKGNASYEITRVAKIEEAGAGSLTFVANPKYEKFLATTKASAVLVSKKLDLSKYGDKGSPAFIKVDDPYISFLHVLKKLTPSIDPFPVGVHETAAVASSAKLGNDVVVGAYTVIGDGAVVGDNTKISHGCVVGPQAQIGSDCLIYPNVTVYHQCRLGNRVVIHAGVVIGSDGFGFAPKADGVYEKIPQMGIVQIEDDVEIGSNTTIDRATLGETLIKRGVKIDNLVQIAHNVVVGEHTVIAAQTGISGSTKIGKNCVIAGQVGVSGHVEIADRTTILGQSGISKSITQPGRTYFGYPAKEIRKSYRSEAALRMLPELMEEVRELQRKVESLAASREQKSK